MLVAIGAVRVIVNSGFAAVMVRRSIGVRMRGSVRLCFVNVCRRLIVGQTMCNAPKRDRSVRREHAECVKRGDTERRTDTKSLPQHSAHRVIKNESRGGIRICQYRCIATFLWRLSSKVRDRP